MEGPSSGTVLFRTFSVCPTCAIVDRSGVGLKSATVLENYGSIWIDVLCNKHDVQRTRICSNAAWWKKMNKISDLNPPETTVDIEDLKKALKPKPATLPLIVEVTVFDQNRFISEQEIDKQLKSVKVLYPRNVEHIVKVSGKLSDDMVALNERVLFITKQQKNRLLVQLSFERLSILTHLENSCFLKPRVYPSVEYYLSKGNEKECMDELGQLFRDLKNFDGIRLKVALHVEPPLPDLSSILTYLRVQIGFINFIEIVLQRTPGNIKAAISSNSKLDSFPKELVDRLRRGEKMRVFEGGSDPFLLLQAIGHATGHTVSVDDFVPVSDGTMLEPFIAMLGLGRYQIRPSASCGYATCLVNSKKYFSTPVTKLFDVEKLQRDLTPLLPDLLKENIGLLTLGRLKSVIDGCKKKGVKLPSLIKLLLDSSRKEKTLKFIDKLQFLVVHNMMDIATLDMERRCNCTTLTKKSLESGFVAPCNGCY